MPTDTTAIETTNANKIFDIPVKLEPGQVNTMSFPQDSISEMRLLPGDQLEVAFRDGSKVQIENFRELVNSAQSCGRDTIIQLSDNTIIYPEELNAQLAKGAVAFGDKDAGESTIALDAPKAGQTVEKNIEPGHEYKLGFQTDATSSAAQAGNNLIITFKDGGIMVLKNYFTSMNSDLPPAMTLADGSVVDSTALLTSCKIVETPSYASTVGEEQIAQTQVASVEPAAGEEKAAKVAQVEPAAGEDVAAIEPAAGSAGGISGGRGGYGFASEPGGVAFNGINPIGVIGVTSLAYQVPGFRTGPTGGNPGTTAIPVTPGLFIAAAQSIIDESGAHTVGGQVNFDFGNDGPSTTVPPIQPTGNFAVGGSVANGVLTSNGEIVSVVQNGNTYTGTANGQTVFTFVILTDGSYTFTQARPLDHADAANPNDRMTLNFGIVATDRDGDTATTSVNVFVLDDAPTAVNDAATVGSAPLVVNGNVLTNDSAGFDGDKTVVGVSFNGTPVTMPAAGTMTIVGTYGTLVINANGTYTYTSSNTALGTDNFVYTMRDFDGDQSSATLAVTVNDLDTVPTIGNAVNTVDETDLGPITVTGSVATNFFSDGPGTVSGSNSFSSGGSKLGGNLTSNGAAVAVTFANGVYTGTANGQTVFTLTVNANGTYSFTQNGVLDHANAANPNDAITLNFGVRATDADGDTANGSITITVLDDGPLAVADTGTVTAANPTITGNVTTNDDFGSDGKPTHAVTKIIFNGTTTLLPTDGSNVTVTSPNGTLTINHTGQYSYTSTTTTGGVDTFSYVIADRDGDTDTVPATSTLTITTDDIDFTPTVTNAVNTVDETNLGPITVTGSVTANYFSDGPGTVSGSNSFSSGGSKLGGNLTSNGTAVAVTFANGVYTGTANGQTVFTLTVNTNGTYSFTQNGVLDHADKANPNDSIALNFGVRATDNDGDVANGTITINVLDDGPTAVVDTGSVTAANPTITGNVTANDSFGNDGRPVHAVTKVIFNGTTYDLPTNGANVTISSVNGTLTINHTGQYSYTSTTTTGGRDVYNYVIADRDGDTDTVPATSTLTITVDDQDFTPTITNAVNTVDETNLGPITVTGSVTANFFSDGPGTVAGSNSFSSGGSKLGGNLTSNGAAINVAFANGVYTGTANGQTVFTLTVNANGTYSFTQNGVLDHANAANPNDAITLNFGVRATDADGDTANGSITITVLDDGPLAVADVGNVTAANPTITGNVTTNDDFGSDGKPVHAVTKVIFNGTTYDLPTNGANVTISSVNGTLTINHTGQYSYTSTTTTGGRDTYSYVIADRDGDTDTVPATSTLTITTDDIDYTPTVTNDTRTVDETNMNPTTSVAGAVTANYFGDGPGTIVGANTFSSDGSKTGGNLTSNGVAVNVAYANGVYTGTAGGATVFTLTLNTNGSYNFVLNRPLDHADRSDPNDSIGLHFGVIARDADGDVANGQININVLDDGPSIGPATSQIDESNFNTVAGHTVTGAVNVDYGSDMPGTITSNNSFSSTGSQLNGQLSSNGVAVIVTQTATGYVGTANGQEVFSFTINNNGAYTYNQTRILDHADNTDPNDVINLHFGVRATDTDGDTANTSVTVNVLDDGPTVVTTPSALLCVNNYEDNIMLPKDYGVYVSVTADSVGGGNQVMTFTMTGIGAGWVFAADFGSYNAATHTWTYTTGPGADFSGRFYFQPPAGSTTDLNDINVTVVTSENGKSSTTSDDFNIIVAGFDGAGARMASFSDDTGADSAHASNDNLTHYSNVIEESHSETQSAIDSFVYTTTAKEAVSTSHVSTNESSTSSVAALAPTAAEELHHAQQQVA